MKMFKKILVACAAITSLTLALTASAFAADLNYSATGVALYDSLTGKASIDMSALAAESGQLTVLILDKDAVDTDVAAEDILYIDQGEKGADNLFQGMGLKGGVLLTPGTYQVKVGGADLAAIYTGTIVVEEGNPTPTYVLGDCDGAAGINVNDATVIIKHVAGTSLLVNNNLLAADVDGVKGVNVNDATTIIKYVAGTISKFTPAPAE